MRSFLIALLLALTAPTAALQNGLKKSASIDRRAAISGFLATVAFPPTFALAAIGDGCSLCTNKELDSSPLIQDLLKKTAENREQNAAAVKDYQNAAAGSVYEAEVKMVRYTGANENIPVTRMMTRVQMKELESLGFEISCPDWGGACSVKEVPKAVPPPLPPPPPPPVEEPAAE